MPCARAVRAERVDGRAGHIDAALPVPPEVVAAFFGPRTDDGAEVQSSRVGRNERFGEKDQPGALPRGVACQRMHLLERPLAIEDNGRRLHDGDPESFSFHRISHRSHLNHQPGWLEAYTCFKGAFTGSFRLKY